MKRNWFISDLHLGHSRIIEIDGRPWGTIEQHDWALVENINETVPKGDTLWLLGDVAHHRKAFESFQLNIRKDIQIQYIRGNHDHRLARSLLQPVRDVHLLKTEIATFWLSHYPHLSWPEKQRGAIHLFGHVHGTLDWYSENSFEVSANVIDYRPISDECIIERVKKQNTTP